MKVYVSELPDSCVGCPCLDSEFTRCNISAEEVDVIVVGSKREEYFKYIDNRHPTCPLQSLSDYTKQVRKEVVQEISKFIEKPENSIYWDCSIYVETEDLRKLLDQIQGETK